jgi:hypothetical protein
MFLKHRLLALPVIDAAGQLHASRRPTTRSVRVPDFAWICEPRARHTRPRVSTCGRARTPLVALIQWSSVPAPIRWRLACHVSARQLGTFPVPS